ncbi:NAD(P)/FAD-dependent oxidoreductase [Nonomuraea maritima]|uniref:NAD(P)/FAD-dependent oxidoreductase n=1 Tax=Nonomuraea maritima TaxID=683260 RepID=UPI0037112899
MRVVVIGSGIVGASAAYYLSGRGADVTVVDGGYQGAATPAGAGIVCPWVDHAEDDDWYRLTREGARRHPDLVAELGEDIGYAKVGALLVAEDPSDLEPVRGLLRRRHAEAPEMGEVVDVTTPAELFPPLSDTLSALLVPGAARIDGRAVRDALLRAARARGARCRTGAARLTAGGEVVLHPTEGPQERDGAAHPVGEASPSAPLDPAAPQPPAHTEPRRLTGEGTPIDADAVIVAAGGWTGEVCRPLGVELPVYPRRGQILHVGMEGVDTAWWPIVLPRQGPYLLGFPGSRIVIGATIEDVGFAPRITMGGLDELVQAGLRTAPGLYNATVSEMRVGLRPVYAPGPALIGPVTGRVVVATGLSAYGLTAGPFTGCIAAALALGDTPPIDITPYAPPTY